MKQIPLTQGKFAIVDDEDYEFLSQWKWHISHGYALRSDLSSYPKKTISMHRVITGTTGNQLVDHIDRNGLNNQKSNLRIVTRTQNGMNRKSHSGSSSKYKGVSWYKAGKKWEAFITYNKKRKFLGRFKSEIEAAEAYNIAATKFHGEYALLNEIES